MLSSDLTSQAGAPGRANAGGLRWPDRVALMAGIVEITLQIDKYLFFHESDAKFGAVAGLNFSVTTLALAFLYLRWIFDASLNRRVGVTLSFGLPMVVYIALTGLSALSASYWMLSAFDVAILVQAYLLFFYLANRLRTHGDLVWCLVTLATTLVMQFLAICFVELIGMSNETRSFGPIVLEVDEAHRHCGTMNSPVLAGSTLALIWLPVAASLTFVRNRWAWRYLLAATLFGMLAILMTQTRGAILTSVVGSLIIAVGMFIRGWLPRWVLALGLVLAMLSAYPLVLVYQNRIAEGDGGSAASRKHLSLIALELISQRPFSGYGAGNCHLATQRVADQGKYRAEWFYTTHSKYLLVWLETGLFGLLAFLAVLGTGLMQGLLAWRARDRALSTLGLALAAAIAGHSLHLAVDVFNSRTQVQMLWCVLGLVAAVSTLTLQTSAARYRVRRRHRSFGQPTYAATSLSATGSPSREGGLS